MVFGDKQCLIEFMLEEDYNKSMEVNNESNWINDRWLVSYNGHPVLVEALNKSNGYAVST
jgi:hypothetical protein